MGKRGVDFATTQQDVAEIRLGQETTWILLERRPPERLAVTVEVGLPKSGEHRDKGAQ